MQPISASEQWHTLSTSVSRVVEDVPWVAGSADFVEGVNQGVLMLGLERNVEIDLGSGGGVA